MTTIVKAAILSAALITGSSSLVHPQSGQPIDMFGKRFIPEGHSYDSSNKELPSLNSYADQTTNRADVFETEIYKARRDRAYWDTWVNSTHGTYLDGQPRLTPDY
jgi:hypothetical protein